MLGNTSGFNDNMMQTWVSCSQSVELTAGVIRRISRNMFLFNFTGYPSTVKLYIYSIFMKNMKLLQIY